MGTQGNYWGIGVDQGNLRGFLGHHQGNFTGKSMGTEGNGLALLFSSAGTFKRAREVPLPPARNVCPC